MQERTDVSAQKLSLGTVFAQKGRQREKALSDFVSLEVKDFHER